MTVSFSPPSGSEHLDWTLADASFAGPARLRRAGFAHPLTADFAAVDPAGGTRRAVSGAKPVRDEKGPPRRAWRHSWESEILSVCRDFRGAAEGTRTLDLLHGKRSTRRRGNRVIPANRWNCDRRAVPWVSGFVSPYLHGSRRETVASTIGCSTFAGYLASYRSRAVPDAASGRRPGSARAPRRLSPTETTACAHARQAQQPRSAASRRAAAALWQSLAARTHRRRVTAKAAAGLRLRSRVDHVPRPLISQKKRPSRRVRGWGGQAKAALGMSRAAGRGFVGFVGFDADVDPDVNADADPDANAYPRHRGSCVASSRSHQVTKIDTERGVRCEDVLRFLCSRWRRRSRVSQPAPVRRPRRWRSGRLPEEKKQFEAASGGRATSTTAV